MYILYDFVCYDLFHILLSCDKIMDPWNVYMYVCMYVCMYYFNLKDSIISTAMDPLKEHTNPNLKYC
jgi:hypothetical protein